jgi:hypothetical protein
MPDTPRHQCGETNHTFSSCQPARISSHPRQSSSRKLKKKKPILDSSKVTAHNGTPKLPKQKGQKNKTKRKKTHSHTPKRRKKKSRPEKEKNSAPQ